MAEINIDETKMAVKITSEDESVVLVYWLNEDDGVITVSQDGAALTTMDISGKATHSYSVNNWRALHEVLQTLHTFLEWQKVKDYTYLPENEQVQTATWQNNSGETQT